MEGLAEEGKGWCAGVWRTDRWGVVGQLVRLAGGGIEDCGQAWSG